MLEEYLRNNPDAQNLQQQAQQQQQQRPAPGDLAASSIFEDDRRVQEQAERDAASEQDAKGDGKPTIGGIARDPQNMARALDPDPNARERWERKKVIQMVKRGGRLSKTQHIKRTEREHLVRSHNMKTSVKKLGMLARQIAGKTVDDAIVQMRFSKKKVAQDLLKQLEFARDEAVVVRGMGLGNVPPAEEASKANDTSAAKQSLATPPAAKIRPTAPKTVDVETNQPTQPLEIQLKDGKRHVVTDKSKIYIDQAWVGRGPYGQLPDYRARGQIYLMRTPFTSISVLLKEEATRVREYEAREEKRRRQRLGKVWVPLPDRPIQTQRQWYSW